MCDSWVLGSLDDLLLFGFIFTLPRTNKIQLTGSLKLPTETEVV